MLIMWYFFKAVSVVDFQCIICNEYPTEEKLNFLISYYFIQFLIKSNFNLLCGYEI